MDIVNPQVEAYMRTLLDRYDEPVLLEMEAEGRDRGFPIIGRLVGVTVELLARTIGARRVFELGSGFGYSAYWFGRAVGPGGEVHGTDGDPANEQKALAYLSRAGLEDRIRWHAGDAVTSLAGVDGAFDVVYCDVDKEGYPEAWRAARDRVRVGGLYLCDNVLWSGDVVDPGGENVHDRATTDAIVEHNGLVAEDPRYVSSIVPTRDGLVVALRIA
ncbi:MAG: O-methyltransferase [Actinomycetota bacterium]